MLGRNCRLIRNSRGDTIIEVLISVAVLSFILAISYNLANKNSQYVRTAQERGEAQKLAEEQLERLRNYITPTTSWASADVCFPKDADADDDSSPNPTAVEGDCKFGPNEGAGGRYTLRIIPSDDDTYTAEASRDTLSGSKAKLELSSRLPAPTLFTDAPSIDCSDGENNDAPEDTLIDMADPGCDDPADDSELNPPPPPNTVNVVVRKIPPAPGNNTPSCASPATQNRSGTRVSLGGQTRITDSSSTASFAGLSQHTNYSASIINVPAGFSVCPPNSQSITTGSGGSVQQLNFKIYPNCSLDLTGYNSYWAYGNRRADLDGWYVTLNGGYPTWNTSFIAGHYTGAAPGSFWYVFSGSTSGSSAYYWLYEALWRSDPIYSMTCPS